MTDRRIHPRLPEGTERVVSTGIEPRSGGSMILAVVTVGEPLELTEQFLFLDPYATWSLLRAMTRQLHDLQDPGPTPEFAALLDAVRTGDQTAITAAGDALNDRILSLWTDGGTAV
ncbi:hypothetical protein SGFS_083290 [Streptomyces graminofaciens]|uniref:Uncharacterized protein n=1 Tax=Streptomyces graminofaciens TaxID=68212 RepID=A0ABN5VUW6_9ACTN|nr:hypothetical protein [Streptomyces graminofaciens]BBC37035.1 hypothetical protein SGFS_083290 [Streptomyces graminofaciens]